jgi:hypothetical protein
MAAACSTGHHTAKKHLDNGEYESALGVYSQILQENPRDSRASEGLRRAREGVISRRLISVRFARLGRNNEQALELLRQIVADERNWGVYPTGPAFSTQREEVEENFHDFSKMIDAALAARYPLAAKLYFDKYKPIFWQGGTLRPAKDIAERIDGLGRKSCTKFASEITQDHFYFRRFVERYCGYWGVEKALSKTPSRPASWDGVFSVVALEGAVLNLPEGASASLVREQLQRALEATPYYDPRSPNPLPIKLQGQFKSTMQENIVNLEHSYFEQEPYTEHSEVNKKRSIPYDELVQVSSSPTKVVTMRKIKVEEYTEPRAITKYKRVSRFHAFIGVRYRQDIVLQIDGKADIAGRLIGVSLSEVDHREGVAHDIDLPAIGLRKQSRQIIEAVPWLTERFALLRTSFRDKLEGLWFDSFCKNESRGGGLTGPESAHRCGQSKRGRDSELVIRWFKSRLGVLPAEAQLAFAQ